jgi:cytochrome b561
MIDATRTSAPATGIPAYTVTARVLHWLIAVLVLIQIPLGVVIANEWGGPWQQPLYNLHKSFGAVILPLVIVRLLWRWTHPPLPLPDDIPPLQQFAAHTTHWALYALLIVQPVIGWIATSAYPAPLPVFGLFELPKIWGEDKAFAERLFVVHRWLGGAIAVVAAMHIGAALHHHFVRKDRVLMRMLTGG